MADVALAVVIGKWPHIPPNGLLFGCIILMAIGLAVAFKWPQKPKTPKN